MIENVAPVLGKDLWEMKEGRKGMKILEEIRGSLEKIVIVVGKIRNPSYLTRTLTLILTLNLTLNLNLGNLLSRPYI